MSGRHKHPYFGHDFGAQGPFPFLQLSKAAVDKANLDESPSALQPVQTMDTQAMSGPSSDSALSGIDTGSR